MYSLTIELRFSEKATFQVLPCQNFTCKRRWKNLSSKNHTMI
jgi:hypothetical protein